MEIRDLRYFVAVAEHQNVGRAAVALDLSPTALGKSLRRLEKSVGAKLTSRSPKGVALTAVGAALLDRIGPLEGMVNDVRHEAANLAQGHAGHVTVGVHQGSSESFLAAASAALPRHPSSITLKITVAHSADFKTAMNKDEMDFCVSVPHLYSPSEFTFDHLFDAQIIVLASSSHHLAKRKQVSITDLAGERWATVNGTTFPEWQMLFRAFAVNRLPPPLVALETNSQAIRLAAVAYSDYLGIASRQLLRQEARKLPLVELPLKEFLLTNTHAIVYRKGAYLSPAAKRLIGILKAQVKEMPGAGPDKRAAGMK
jgi:DNA-binding transcriptional LysR family regulator